jgi:hypothetical protein
MPFVILRQVPFRGEIVERSQEILGDTLRIGRGMSNDLRLDDLAVSLSHAVILQDSSNGYLIRDLTGRGATYVNRMPVTDAVLRTGDTIRIERYLLQVSQPDSENTLVLSVSEEVAPQEEIGPNLLSKLQLSSTRLTKRSISVTVVLCILIGTALAWGLGHRAVLMPGSVSAKHAKFSNQCEKCHDSWKPVWNLVPNKTCQSCHPADILTPSHFDGRSVKLAPLCASCHLEHKGLVALADVPDKKCIQCHGRLEVKDPRVEVATDVHDFTKSHPEFAISRFDPERRRQLRVRLDDKVDLRDDGQLKLNHELHLAPELKTTTGSETLTCISCHRVDETGRDMQSMTYQRDCMRCHALEFDPLLPGRSVTHGRQPSELRQELEEIYAAYYLRDHPEELKKPEGARRLPGQPLTAKEKFVEDRRGRAERVLFPPKGKVCLKCHYAEIAKEMRSNILSNTKNNTELSPQNLLDNLHDNSLLSPSIVRMNSPAVPKRWLPYSRFDHDAHRGLPELRAKDTWCLFCHEAAAHSKRTEDVLLPRIDLCRTCHFEPGGAQEKCSACHDFHARETRARGSFSVTGVSMRRQEDP